MITGLLTLNVLFFLVVVGGSMISLRDGDWDEDHNLAFYAVIFFLMINIAGLTSVVFWV